MKKVQSSSQQLAECNTTLLLNCRSPLSVLKLHLFALTWLPRFFFVCFFRPPFVSLLSSASSQTVTETADKSIAITPPVLSCLSRVSSSFIFIPQQPLRGLSPSLLSGAFTSHSFVLFCSRTDIVINKTNSGTDNNLSLIKEWWSPERKAAVTLNYSAFKWIQVIFMMPDKRFGFHIGFSAQDIGNWNESQRIKGVFCKEKPLKYGRYKMPSWEQISDI